jgi:hypothetical protein
VAGTTDDVADVQEDVADTPDVVSGTSDLCGSSVEDPGSGAFLTPGSGIGFFRIPDP